MSEASADELQATVRAFAMSDEETRGQLIVEINCNDQPVDARCFAEVIIDTVKCLNALAKADGDKNTKFALIEANVIGDRASFTLKGYDKAAFKKKKPT